MTENMKAFMDALKNNEELKEKVAEIDKKAEKEPEKHIDEYIAVAKEYGISLAREDFFLEQQDASEMTDDELQAVTGGKEDNHTMACFFIGDDVPDEGEVYCGCAFVGAAKGCGCFLGGVSE